MLGRFERVRFHRPFGSGLEYGPPVVLDRRYNTFSPYVTEGWWKSPDGVWYPTMRGGVGPIFSVNYMSGLWLGHRHTYGDRQNLVVLNLDSAYTYGSAGDCVGWGVLPLTSSAVSKISIYQQGQAGTPGNLSIEIRDEAAVGTAPGPGTTLHESQTSIAPLGSPDWITTTGWTFTPTLGTPFWIVCGCATGGASDYVGLGISKNATATQYQTPGHFRTIQSTNGFTTLGTNRCLQTPFVVVEFADGTANQGAVCQPTWGGSNTNSKGYLVKSGAIPREVEIFGLMGEYNATYGASATGTYNLWGGSDGPTGTPLQTGTTAYTGNSATAVQGWMATTPYTLGTTTQYRIINKPDANNNMPYYESHVPYGGSGSANSRMGMPGAGNWYYTQSNGTSDWSNDNVNRLPDLALVIRDYIESAGGGMLVSPGMSGGMRG